MVKPCLLPFPVPLRLKNSTFFPSFSFPDSRWENGQGTLSPPRIKIRDLFSFEKGLPFPSPLQLHSNRAHRNFSFPPWAQRRPCAVLFPFFSVSLRRRPRRAGPSSFCRGVEFFFPLPSSGWTPFPLNRIGLVRAKPARLFSPSSFDRPPPWA